MYIAKEYGRDRGRNRQEQNQADDHVREDEKPPDDNAASHRAATPPHPPRRTLLQFLWHGKLFRRFFGHNSSRFSIHRQRTMIRTES